MTDNIILFKVSSIQLHLEQNCPSGFVIISDEAVT